MERQSAKADVSPQRLNTLRSCSHITCRQSISNLRNQILRGINRADVPPASLYFLVQSISDATAADLHRW